MRTGMRSGSDVLLLPLRVVRCRRHYCSDRASGLFPMWGEVPCHLEPLWHSGKVPSRPPRLRAAMLLETARVLATSNRCSQLPPTTAPKQ